MTAPTTDTPRETSATVRETTTPCALPGPWHTLNPMRQRTHKPRLLAAILGMALAGCNGKGCRQDVDTDTAGPGAQTCQVNNAKYVCPTGYFCKYDDPKQMANPKMTGKCEATEKYQPCMNATPCGSSDYAPKCETVNETAYCDWFQTSLRCWCDKPGPFTPLAGEAEAADGDEVKTPTTTN